MTPHIRAKRDAFASVVIMPDDPLQARFAADHYLDDVEEATIVRNMLGYTGFYNGSRVSIMGAGLGVPSVSIYARELFIDYRVEAIISTTECYAISHDISVRTLILAMGASTFSGVNRMRFGGGDFSAISNFELLSSAWVEAQELSMPVVVGNVCTTDCLCESAHEQCQAMQTMGVLALEMTAAGLYGVAAECGRKALSICPIREHLHSGDYLPADDRDSGARSSLQLALKVAGKFAHENGYA